MPVLSLLNSLTDLNSRVIEQKKDRDYNCRVHTHTLSVCKTFWSQETNMLSRADRQHVPKVKVACSYASYARQIYRFQGFLRSRSTRAEILVETSEFSRRHSTRRVSRKLSVYVMKTSA
jgi:vacuolar-type H+-ATPase catalytic subunit A/Vma1